jgi:hypothetical protein
VVIFGVVVWDRIVPILLGGLCGATSLIFGLLFEIIGGPNTETTDLVVIASMLSAAIFGPLGALVAHRKNLGWPTGFIFGFGLGLIGFVVMLRWRPGRPTGQKRASYVPSRRGAGSVVVGEISISEV